MKIKRIDAAYRGGFEDVDRMVNEWLRLNDITPDELIKVTIHHEKEWDGYEYKRAHYGIVYYNTEREMLTERRIM